MEKYLCHFQPISTSVPPENIRNIRNYDIISDVFRGYRSGILFKNGIITVSNKDTRATVMDPIIECLVRTYASDVSMMFLNSICHDKSPFHIKSISNEVFLGNIPNLVVFPLIKVWWSPQFIPFYTPRKHQKTPDFLMSSGRTNIELWWANENVLINQQKNCTLYRSSRP